MIIKNQQFQGWMQYVQISDFIYKGNVSSAVKYTLTSLIDQNWKIVLTI